MKIEPASNCRSGFHLCLRSRERAGQEGAPTVNDEKHFAFWIFHFALLMVPEGDILPMERSSLAFAILKLLKAL
jgi:hypothetical protein